MSTYPGRETEHDLGNGFSFAWLYSDDLLIGLHEHHPPTAENASLGDKHCGGYVQWAHDPKRPDITPKHQLVAGGPGDEQSLTIMPSLLCRRCGEHGFIQDGKWVPA